MKSAERRIAALAVAAILCMPVAACGAKMSHEAALEHARLLLRSTPLVDGHNDLPRLIREEAGGDVP